jgi:hypothetical protein
MFVMSEKVQAEKSSVSRVDFINRKLSGRRIFIKQKSDFFRYAVGIRIPTVAGRDEL